MHGHGILISARSPAAPGLACRDSVIPPPHLHANIFLSPGFVMSQSGYNLTEDFTFVQRVMSDRVNMHVSSFGSSRLCMTLWGCTIKSHLAPPNICNRLASVIAICKQCLDQIGHLIRLKLEPQLAFRPQIFDVRQ